MSSAAEAEELIRRHDALLSLFSNEIDRYLIRPAIQQMVTYVFRDLDMERRYCRAEGFGDPYPWMDPEERAL